LKIRIINDYKVALMCLIERGEDFLPTAIYSLTQIMPQYIDNPEQNSTEREEREGTHETINV